MYPRDMVFLFPLPVDLGPQVLLDNTFFLHSLCYTDALFKKKDFSINSASYNTFPGSLILKAPGKLAAIRGYTHAHCS